ncbi:MAG: hypothetical protein OXC07_04275, partial [Kistimonas sp.]|nr:hypothetical protein [Kistimonas sp.]
EGAFRVPASMMASDSGSQDPHEAQLESVMLLDHSGRHYSLLYRRGPDQWDLMDTMRPNGDANAGASLAVHREALSKRNLFPRMLTWSLKSTAAAQDTSGA